jgi:WD40 repeat protein
MSIAPILWREVHRHRGALTALKWSPSGSNLCCSSFDGEVTVIGSDTCTVTRLTKSYTADNEEMLGVIADWDQKSEAVAINATGTFRVLDVKGNELVTGDGPWAYKMSARPDIGGYACVQYVENGFRVAFIDSGGKTTRLLGNSYQTVEALSWSPAGKHLAVANERGVSILSPSREICEFFVPGGANAVAWLDAMRLAVGCEDTNIRIYGWTAEPNVRVAPELLEVLELHDLAIEVLASRGNDAELASVDRSGLIYFWTQGIHGLQTMYSCKQSATDTSSILALTFHPFRPLVAIDVDRVVKIGEYNRQFPKPPADVLADGTATPIETVLSKANLIGLSMHSDSVGAAWEVSAAGWNPPFDEKVRTTKVCKHLANITRILTADIANAMRTLCRNWPIELQVKLERMAFAPKGGKSNVLEVRKQLLAMLAGEILADLPRSRPLASAAYVGIGYLGVSEAEIAFGEASSVDSLLTRLDGSMRRMVFAAQLLISARDADTVKMDLKAASDAVANVVSQARSGPQSNSTDVKDGVEKGLPHVGVLLEIERRPVYVSYAWGQESDSLVDKFEKQLPASFELRYDKRSLRPGDWISTFMAEIERAEDVVIILNQKYLRSMNCMRELLGLFRASHGEKSEFLNKIVPVTLGDLRCANAAERLEHVDFWTQQREELERKLAAVAVASVGDADRAELRCMIDTHNNISDMLAWLADMVMPRGADLIPIGIPSAIDLLKRRALED